MIGDNIRLYRIKKGLTQEALALEIGITQGAVWQWENGRSTPATSKLKEIASCLSCTVDDLLKDAKAV